MIFWTYHDFHDETSFLGKVILAATSHRTTWCQTGFYSSPVVKSPECIYQEQGSTPVWSPSWRHGTSVHSDGIAGEVSSPHQKRVFSWLTKGFVHCWKRWCFSASSRSPIPNSSYYFTKFPWGEGGLKMQLTPSTAALDFSCVYCLTPPPPDIGKQHG